MEAIFESIFLKILNMSMTASYIIIAVILVRLLLRKAPKKYSYALWTVAAFRLVCPVSFRSVISIFSLRPFSLSVEGASSAGTAAQIVHIPENIGFMAQPEIHTGLEAVNAVVNESLPAASPMASANPIQIWIFFGMILWCLGIAVLLCLSTVSLWRLHRALRTATKLEGNVWQSENVRSPFIVGLIKPKIYIPYGLGEPRLGYVLSHERAHIKRLDHVVKTLSFLIFCLHWFNPLVWLAFYLMGRDMELSCDEKVLGRIDDKAEYSETLLSFASPRRFPTPTPLAFGESGVAQRIKNALRWHRPKLWVSIVALSLCLCVIAACAANPTGDENEGGPEEMYGTWVPVECVYQSPVYSWYPFGGDNGYTYEFHPDGLRIYDHDIGEWRGGVGPAYQWQEFPYTDEEWAEMFIYPYVYVKPISEYYDEILYQPLGIDIHGLPMSATEERDTNGFLMMVDGELWIGSLNTDTNGHQWIQSIYALERQENMGMASFVYPDSTSNEPGIEISFSESFESVSVTTSGGGVSAFANGDSVGGMGTDTTVPANGSLFWCPIQNDRERPEAYNLTQSAVIRLTVDHGGSSQNFSIYVSYADGAYTLRPVGKGVYLSQNGEKSAMLTFDAAHTKPTASATDIPAGSPWGWTSSLSITDIVPGVMGFGSGLDQEKILADGFSEKLVAALNSVQPDEIRLGRGIPSNSNLTIYTEEGNCTLRYGGDFVEMSFSYTLAERYSNEGGIWEIRNEGLNAMFDELTNAESASGWDTTGVDIFGESEIFGYTDIKSAVDLVLAHMESSNPSAEVTLLRLGYDEEISLREAEADAGQYGADEAIVLVSDFEVGESWGAFDPNSTYTGWKWILTRSEGEDWVLRTWGYG